MLQDHNKPFSESPCNVMHNAGSNNYRVYSVKIISLPHIE